MNTQTENAKREMYGDLQKCTGLFLSQYGVACLAQLEGSLERYLDLLAQERKAEVAKFAEYQQRAIDAESENKRLTKQLHRATGEVSRKTRWMRAAVADNKRIREDNKAFRVTQDEMVEQIAHLNAAVAAQDCARATINENPSKGSGYHKSIILGRPGEVYEAKLVNGILKMTQRDTHKNPESPVNSRVCDGFGGEK